MIMVATARTRILSVRLRASQKNNPLISVHRLFGQALQKRRFSGDDLFSDDDTSLSMLTSTPVRARTAGVAAVENWNSMTAAKQLQILYEVAR
jgi:hypothetical protein